MKGTIKMMAITLCLGITSCKKIPVPNVAPTVSISTPADKAVFITGENIILTSSASDTDGTISKVEFFDGPTLLGSATATPYTYTWANASPGNHVLTVKATDNSGAITTSLPINITVNIGFKATLNGASERPDPVTTVATGTSIGSYNITTKVLSVTTSYSGIVITAGHLHKGDATVAGPVIFGFSSPLASPINFMSPVLNSIEEADLMGNLLYVNLHSMAFPGGEIRGQLLKQ